MVHSTPIASKGKARAGEKKPDKKSAPKTPRKMTRARMENIAMYYVQRYASSCENLRRVLMRRADKARRFHGGDRNEEKEWIEDIVSRFTRSDVLNDARYALGRATALRRLGRSPAKIRAHLAQKGVAKNIVDKVISDTAISETGSDATMDAALAYARRRRLGPFALKPCSKEDQKTLYKKHLAAMARAGFSYDIARRVLETNDE